MLITTKTLPAPKNQKAKILRALIVRPKGISERDFRLNGFRSRISNLRELGLNIRHIVVKKYNEFGHPLWYRVHFLRESEKEKAIRIYNQINKG